MTLSLGTIASGATATVPTEMGASALGTLATTATVTANEVDPNPADNTATRSTPVVP